MLSRLDRLFLKFAFKRTRAKKFYEPIEIDGRKYDGKREFELRWQAISEVISSCAAGSVLDIGCSEGWFLRRAAQDHGCFALGVDANPRRVLSGELARLHDGIEKVAIMHGRLAPSEIAKLPAFDVVLCLSVVHHIMRDSGVEGAERFVQALAARTKKAFVFEMGTSDEAQLTWTKVLPSMSEGQEEFITAFLRRCGLKDIRIIGETQSLKRDASRILFMARPSADD